MFDEYRRNMPVKKRVEKRKRIAPTTATVRLTENSCKGNLKRTHEELNNDGSQTNTDELKTNTDELKTNESAAAMGCGLVYTSSDRISQHTINKYRDIRATQAAFIELASKRATNPIDPKLTAVLREKELEAYCNDVERLKIECQQDLRGITDMITRVPHNTMSTVASTHHSVTRPDVCIVTRAWEEAFLHEATGCERPCANRASRTCFASLISHNGVLDPSFALCEFYTEPEYKAIKAASWIWPDTLRPCILCLRNIIYRHLYNVRCNDGNVLSSVNFAPIGNLVGIAGEYCIENVFVSRPDIHEGVYIPVVIPCVADYDILQANGVRAVIQRLPRPEHQSSSFFF